MLGIIWLLAHLTQFKDRSSGTPAVKISELYMIIKPDIMQGFESNMKLGVNEVDCVRSAAENKQGSHLGSLDLLK